MEGQGQIWKARNDFGLSVEGLGRSYLRVLCGDMA